ncbi:MAG: ATP-binding protein [Thermoanaerobaculia bacterium]
MELPFLDRDEETARLARLLESPEGALAVLYGRRRCGKSRLLREVLPQERSIYYVGDEREAALQRASLSSEIARLLPGFDRVTYPDWDPLCALAAAQLPFVEGREVFLALWLKEPVQGSLSPQVIDPQQVLAGLR